MLNKRELIMKILIFVVLFSTIYTLTYFTSYLKYNNKKYIETNNLIIENQLLKKELQELNQINVKSPLIAKVILRDIYSFYDEIIINLGKSDVKINDAVINEQGLIGIVNKVTDNYSYVALLSSNHNISVRIGDTYGNLNKGTITMIDKYSNIEIGDFVYTSGLDEVAGDIYVGKVIKINKDKDNLGKEVKIEYINNNNLNYVGVIRKIQ